MISAIRSYITLSFKILNDLTCGVPVDSLLPVNDLGRVNQRATRVPAVMASNPHPFILAYHLP